MYVHISPVFSKYRRSNEFPNLDPINAKASVNAHSYKKLIEQNKVESHSL